MLKATLSYERKDGTAGRMLILGIEPGNIERLVGRRHPIFVRGTDVQGEPGDGGWPEDCDVMVAYGDSLEDIVAMLQEAGIETP